MKKTAVVRRWLGAVVGILALGLATQASAQTLVKDECYSDDFMPMEGNDQVFDLSISLYSTPSIADRAFYEETLRHFAKGIYEMSNGKHKIRNIVIHQDGKQKRFASIIWARGVCQEGPDGNPAASGIGAVTHAGGVIDPLGKIYMFDCQEDALSDPIIFRDLVRKGPDHRKLEGYILAHEFGHWAYSLGDEYVRGDVHENQVVSVMSDVQASVNAGTPQDNLQWLNFSTMESIHWSTNGRNTTQYEQHSQSSWEYLVTPCILRSRNTGKASGVIFPDGVGQTTVLHYPKNVFYTQLSATGVAPTSTDRWTNPNDGVSYPTLRPNLTGIAFHDDPLALDHFKVTWMDTANVEMDLILDTSGSMGVFLPFFGFIDLVAPIDQVKLGAEIFTGQSVIARTTLGVTTFSDTPNINAVPLTPIDSSLRVNLIQSQISQISPHGATAMFAAAKQSLAKLQAYRAAHGTNALQVAFLLSDGEDNASGGVTEAEVIQLYKAAGVRLHTVGYTDNPDQTFLGTLQRLAAGTGGVYHRALTKSADIAEAMRIAYGDVLTLQDIEISGLGEKFPVDTGYYELSFNVNYRLNAGGGVTFGVQGPAGANVPVSVSTRGEPDGSATALITVSQAGIQQAGTGYWTLVPTFTGAGGTIVSKRLQGTPGAAPPIELMMQSTKHDYVYPEPIQVQARTVLDGDITSLTVHAQLNAPNGAVIPIVLSDDGMGVDASANDGLYTGQLINYDQNGVYSLQVNVENLGSAVYVRPQGERASNGGPVAPEFVLVGVPFSRSAKATLSVSGVVADDHGNSPGVATSIAPNGAPRYGKIETAGDVDFFRVDGASATSPLSVRVSDQVGIVPKVTVYASDGVTVLKSSNLRLGATVGGYLSVSIPAAQVASPLYVKVEDYAGTGVGTYTIDAGAPISSDAVAPPSFISQLPNGDLQFAITFSAPQAYVGLFAEKNGASLLSENIVGSQIDNGDGSFTYVRTSPASGFQAGDLVRARYHSFETSSPTVLTPGPTPDIFLPTFFYGGGFQCPTAPLGSCASSLLAPVSVTSSSTQDSGYPASLAIDGDFATRWSSAFGDPQWITLDLGATRFVHRAILYWEDAASSDYDIQLSDNGTTWTTAYTDHNGNGGTDDVTGINASGRYVRIYSRHRTTQWGNSLWEVLLFGDNVPSCSAQAAIARPCVSREPTRVGGMSFEKWTGISGSSVNDIPTSSPPDYIQNRVTFEGLHNITDNYGVRMRGWVTPPMTGAYKFWVAGDDNVALYLSSSALPSGKALIAHQESFTGFREWNKFASQHSSPITLQRGRWYYIEALMKEQSGDDHLSVGWLKPGETGTQPSELIPAVQLAPFTDSSLPPPVALGYRTMRNVNSNKCVDVTNNSMDEGANVQQWLCTANDNAQVFDLKSRGDGRYWLINRTSKKCVHVAANSTADGANVEQRTCDGQTSNIWQLVSLGSDQFRAINLKSSKCLDVAGAGTLSGTNIQQATCTSNLAQAYTFGSP